VLWLREETDRMKFTVGKSAAMSLEALMFEAHTGVEQVKVRPALVMTIKLDEAVYWSRTRQALWQRGAASGLVPKVLEMRINDDQDAAW